MKKEEELASTNKLLQIIRGDTESQKGERSEKNQTLADSPPSDNKPPIKTPPGGENVPLQKVDDFHPTLKKEINHKNKKTISHEKDHDDPPQMQTKMEDQFSKINDQQKTKNTPNKNTHFNASNSSKKEKQILYKSHGELRGNINSYLGLDIGSRSIKFVQIQHKLNKQNLISWGIIKIPPIIEKENKKPQVTILKNLLTGISNSRIKVISSIGGPSVIVRHIKFPPLSDKEIEESIKWESKTYIPFPLREVNIDYQILGRSPKNKQVDVLLVAVTKKLLKEHLESLHYIQINPHIVDINSLALVNCYTMNNEHKEERATVLLDIGASTTILNIYKKNDFFFTRDIPIAGDVFTSHIQEKKHLNYEDAENSKRDKGFPLNTIKPALDNLIKEIRRSLIYYDNQTMRKGFSRVILSGGSSRLSGLAGYLSEELGLKVNIANPLRSINIDPKKFSLEELDLFAPHIALAIGLTNK